LLVGLKQNVFRQLKDQGMLSDPISQVMEENVMPWLFERTLAFLREEGVIEVNAESQLTDGINEPKAAHKAAIVGEYRRREQAEKDRIQSIEDKAAAKILRKEERRVKRRLRDIDAMVELIKKEILDKGEMREGVTSINLDQVHANYRQGT